MAPIEIVSPPSYLPLATSAAHLFGLGWLSVVAARTIYRSYVALPPSSATRHREPLRRGHVHTFTALAVISLAVGGFFAATFSGLSYRIWAAQRGIELPGSVFGDQGALRGGEHPGRLHLARWLNDVLFYQDALEIVAEKHRHFWWGQQVNLGLVSWSVYVAVEGRRRNISNLWTFLALAQLVNLSYAQNLFFIAVLLTPVPLPENVSELTRDSVPARSTRYSHFVKRFAKPDGFLPRPALYIVLLVANFTSIFLIPFAANTPSFMTVSIASRIIPFSFLLLPYIIPNSFGKIHTHPHSAHSTYTTIFRTISVIAAALHLKSTILALVSNTPERYAYRHSLLHPFQEEKLTTLDRGSTALGRLFGAIGEHPAVSAVGWDVIMSGLSLGVWAGIRALDAWEMLDSSVVFMKRTAKAVQGTSGPTLKQEIVETVENIVEATPSRRGPGRPRKTEKVEDTDDASSVVSLPRRRGKPSKKAVENHADATYKPAGGDQLEEGDENVEEDWESAAMAWGMIIAGGLGTGSAGIFGADMKARWV
ncbi:hypothetical protein LSUB1_G003725 [Lachnellula subtilissima]|uniref:Uncharacterized protein n=1 Tax=Lachnellula subtilissima TaxID=602034 RepID=A0A8H8RQS1_9HELO|nr:hypothetical protein LSUB1_G003725 [Lachnellula subtilissima]